MQVLCKQDTVPSDRTPDRSRMIESSSLSEDYLCNDRDDSSPSPALCSNANNDANLADGSAVKTTPSTTSPSTESEKEIRDIAALSRDVILHDAAFLTLLRTTQVDGDAFSVISICDMYLKASTLDALHRIRLDVANTVLAFMVMRGHENRDKHIAIVLNYQENCRLLYQSLLERGDELDYDRELRLELASTALEVVQNLKPGASLEDASAMFGKCGKRQSGALPDSRKRACEESDLHTQNLQELPLHTSGSKRRRISLWVNDISG